MRDAPSGPEIGAVVRAARAAAGWRQSELGRRCGYSASQISRWETGATPLRDVAVLRALAVALGIDPATLGVTADTGEGRSPRAAHRPPTVGALPTEEDDVRRRQFLLAAALAAGGPALIGSAAAVDPAKVLNRSLVAVLLGPVARSAPLPLAGLRDELAIARAQFSACRYLPLAATLPALISSAEATAAHDPTAAAHRTLAQTYQLASRVLGKLEASSLEWVAADRGFGAARASGDPLVVAEAHRLAGGAARRGGHHQRAQDVTLAGVEVLTAGGRADAAHWGMWSQLHCSAGYAAALRGDRERSRELIDIAEHATTQLVDDEQRRAITSNIVSHRVSAAFALGDAGAALAHGHRLPLTQIPTVERRARLLVDIAQAYAQWDKPDRALNALLVAERTAPGEVHTRNAVRRLVTDLGRRPGSHAMAGLPALAARVHATL